MTSWTPAETWLFVAFVLLAVAFIVWAGWTAHQDRRDRPSALGDMTPDEAHMADLRRLQKQLRADYGVPDPTPVDWPALASEVEGDPPHHDDGVHVRFVRGSEFDMETLADDEFVAVRYPFGWDVYRQPNVDHVGRTLKAGTWWDGGAA